MQFAFYVISARYHLDEVEQRKQNMKQQISDLQHCAGLIVELRIASKPKLEVPLALEVNQSDKPFKYLGLRLVAPFIAQKIEEFSNGQTVMLKRWWDEINSQRAYWARSDAALIGVLKMLPDDFANKLQVQEILGKPAHVFGYMSWILYYIRLGLNLSLMFKHTFEGPWMNEEEKLVSRAERFSTQWHQRKFILINDFIWANLNMVCFIWITGTPLFNYSANALTVAFMTFDISLAIWRMNEESTQHNKNIARYIEDIDRIFAKINSLNPNCRERLILEEELKLLIKAKNSADLEWKYKSYALINDLMYVIGLLAGFAVIAAFLLPPASVTAANLLIFNLVGASLFFGVTLAYTAISNSLTISKTKEMLGSSQEELAGHLDLFKRSNNEFQKRQLYMDIQGLISKSDYQEQLVHFQKVQLLRSLLVNILSWVCGLLH